MGISISIKNLKRLLEVMPAEQNIMLVGRHGIGKSEILTEFYEKRGMKVVALFLGQMSDPGDLIGLPNKDEKTGKTVFLPPYWFPLDGKPVALFLDELNRARPEVLQTIMDLALNRTLAGRKLPEGSVVISAVNDGDEYQLTDLDPALVSRFNVYQFAPTVGEWLLWAEQNKLDNRVVDFIRDHSTWLDGDSEKTNQYDGLNKSPDRRAWKKVSDLIRGVPTLDDDYKSFIAGIVGVRATAAFFSAIKDMKQVSGKDVLMDCKKALKTMKSFNVHQLAVINEDIFRYLQLGDFEGTTQEKVADNLKEYIGWLTKNEKNEVIASFVSMMTNRTYSKACMFIATKTKTVYSKLLSFVSSL